MNIIIITGAPCSGKTHLVKSLFRTRKSVYLCPTDFKESNPFCWDGITNKARRIIVDEICLNEETIPLLMSLSASHGLLINRQSKEAFLLTDVNIIVTTQDEVPQKLLNRRNVSVVRTVKKEAIK